MVPTKILLNSNRSKPNLTGSALISEHRAFNPAITKNDLNICLDSIHFTLPEESLLNNRLWPEELFQNELWSRSNHRNTIWALVLNCTLLFYKKLGSGHSTISFLISHEILSILVLKVS